ncbi:MAG: glycosyltransferase family 2 protein [Nitrospirales bacterium]|nr:glycosyltransferase family 2 protein [Nitrospira sp.]MDR4502168.1 glycosyltransferase family 2 protein [Nitrospirales bacterium]
MNHSPTVAIIILNFNKRHDVLEAIGSAQASDYPLTNVFVVDNASTDGSWESIEAVYPELPKIRMPSNIGAPGGRNAGWRFVQEILQPDYILFLDDDATLAPNAISRFVDATLADSATGIACGKGYTRHPSTILNSIGIRVNLYTGIIEDIGAGEEDRGQYDQPCYVAACGCFGLFIKASLFEQLGGFNEAFNPYGWEDVDLCLRARRLGYNTRYVPAAIIHHKGTKLGRKPLPLYEQTKARNYLYLIREHASWLQLASIGLCLPFRALALMIKLVRQGDKKILLSHARGFWCAFFMPKEPMTKNNQETK